MANEITLNQNCEAVQIPSGSRIILTTGTKLKVVQSLGGTVTVRTEYGDMARLSLVEAESLGIIKPSVSPQGPIDKDKPLQELVWDQLKTCYDPEIPINIVDLGLVYDCKLEPSPEGDGSTDVEIKMTLTAPGCGMGDVLKRDAEEKIKHLPGVRRANVELVWEPAWDQNKMTDAAKLKLGLL